MTPTDAVYLSELDYHIAAEDQETGKKKSPAPPASKKRTATQKRRRPRKDSQSRSSKELPGLFDAPPKDDEAPPEA